MSRLRTYSECRRADARRQTLQGIALVAAIVAFGVALFPFFYWLDCRAAINFADTYQLCIDDPNCDPTKRQSYYFAREGDWKAKQCGRK